MAELGVIIESPSGDRIQVGGRVARMILWLVGRREQINAVPNGSIRVDFAGVRIKPSLTEFDSLTEEATSAVPA
jgi:hypothetical protein